MTELKGWYPDIPNNDYHDGQYKTRIGSTGLKELFRSPAHYRAWKDEKKEPTPAMIFGSAFHSIALGFPEEVAVIPSDIDRRTKAGKVEWSQFQEDSAGKYMIKADEMAAIEGMVDAITHHKYARRLLESDTARKEVAGFFEDYVTELPCKIKPDILDLGIGVISDLKSCIDASYDGFSRAIFNFGYHISASWYRYGFKMIEGYNCEFVLIAVEKTPPHGVNTFPMTGPAIQIANDKIDAAMTQLKECIENDEWPCYPQLLDPPSVPGWVKNQIDI